MTYKLLIIGMSWDYRLLVSLYMEYDVTEPQTLDAVKSIIKKEILSFKGSEVI